MADGAELLLRRPVATSGGRAARPAVACPNRLLARRAGPGNSASRSACLRTTTALEHVHLCNVERRSCSPSRRFAAYRTQIGRLPARPGRSDAAAGG